MPSLGSGQANKAKKLLGGRAAQIEAALGNRKKREADNKKGMDKDRADIQRIHGSKNS